MAATNTKTRRSHVFSDTQLAGGYGVRGAKQDAESQLRRAVLACLLWEDIAYADGVSSAEVIRDLVPLVDPSAVAQIAVEARYDQRLRHVPLLLVREMARHESHRPLVAKTVEQIINRPDEICELLAIYAQDQDGPKKLGKLSKSIQRGIAAAFKKFDEYQLAKWNRTDRDIKLRDALFLCHAKPKDEDQAAMWKRLIDGSLKTPDTWEVGLSAAKSEDDKRDVWIRLIEGNKLGAFAFLKNLRNMQQVKVPRNVIAKGFDHCSPAMLLPIDFLKAAEYAPEWQRELEMLMLKCASKFPKLPGWTIFVVDVSGSMGAGLSSKSIFSRRDAAAAMAILAMEMCDHCTVYVTAGNDRTRIHATKKVRSLRGFGLTSEIDAAGHEVGGGGIFTRQCMDYIRSQEHETPDRIIVFSDSQDCDLPGSGQPKPFGRRNYIVDVSNHSHGINYDGVWTAEVAGWSEHFLRYIAECESEPRN